MLNNGEHAFPSLTDGAFYASVSQKKYRYLYGCFGIYLMPCSTCMACKHKILLFQQKRYFQEVSTNLHRVSMRTSFVDNLFVPF